jgi:RNA polymerase sigma factor FliA
VTTSTPGSTSWPTSEVQPALWASFTADRSQRVRAQLVEHYLPLARTVASRVYQTHEQDGVPFADYLQYARVGLLESIDRFDGARGVPFSAFAQHRIRGAILNGLGNESELLAQRQEWLRAARERRSSLEAEHIPSPRDATLQQFAELAMSLAVSHLLERAAEQIDEAPERNPYAATELRQLRHALRQGIEQLPARERDLLRAHYYEQREFQDIAAQLSLTKGRISQLHARAIAQLRLALATTSAVNRQL